ncbi:MAG: hypothetical protein ACI4D3_13775 [Lachnospiraceae bacterium]
MDKIYLSIRKITIAPIMAALMLTAFYLFTPEIFQSAVIYLSSLFFLGILPILAYPMQKYIPAYKNKGRDGQRILAMIFAVVGYVLGITVGLFLHAPKETILIYLEYLLSGIFIFLLNKCFHVKVSGHTCGIFAPIVLFINFKLFFCAGIGIIVSFLIYISSLKTKRHTLSQLIGGSIIPFAVLFLICFLI